MLTQNEQAGRIYELAGDASYTLAELAGEIAQQSGQAVVYQDLPEADFKAALLAAVHLHGCAADGLVAQGCGPIGLTAGELIDSARACFNRWIGERH